MKILLHGARGVMGRNVIDLAKNTEDCEINCGVDAHAEGADLGFPVYEDIFKVKEDFDVIVDFSVREAVDRLLDFAVEKKKALVLCTTGLSEEQEKKIVEAAKSIPILQSGNMSLGVNILQELVRLAAAKLYKEGFDIEIVEAHHRRKKDAPSGTAIKTAELISKVRPQKHQGAMDEKEILAGARGAEIDGMRIHSVRLPGLVAHQEVIFGGQGEGLTLRHDSYDRKSFMTGVNLGIKEVVKKKELVYGLEYLL